MKLKNQILKTICFLLFASLAVAQKNASKKTNNAKNQQFYFGVSAGYNFAAGANTNQLYSSQELTPTTESQKTIYFSYGKGINFGLQGGYLFNQHFGVELGLNYLSGATTTTDNTYLDGGYFKNILSSKLFQIKPSVVILAGFETINPYAKFGIILAKGNTISNFEGYDVFNGGDRTTQTFKTYGGYGIGFSAATGANYKINNKITVFGELVFSKLTNQPTNGTRTAATKNGVDVLAGSPINQNELEYLDVYIQTGGVPPDPNKPTQQQSFSQNFGSFGLNFGLNFNF